MWVPTCVVWTAGFSLGVVDADYFVLGLTLWRTSRSGMEEWSKGMLKIRNEEDGVVAGLDRRPMEAGWTGAGTLHTMESNLRNEVATVRTRYRLESPVPCVRWNQPRLWCRVRHAARRLDCWFG